MDKISCPLSVKSRTNRGMKWNCPQPDLSCAACKSKSTSSKISLNRYASVRMLNIIILEHMWAEKKYISEMKQTLLTEIIELLYREILRQFLLYVENRVLYVKSDDFARR